MAGPSFAGSPSEIPPEGLTVLSVPATEPSVDIVLVHGFTGHPYLTWRKTGVQGPETDVEDAAEPPRKLAKFLGRSAARESHSVYWPTDLLPSTIPGARIMTYGYDTHLRHKLIGPRPSQNTVYDIAWDLLVALEAERRSAGDRPLIFVAHSLGGIVVKEMLRRSQGCHSHAHLRQIASSTMGVVFFGTPHSGADPRGPLLHAAESLVRMLGLTVNQAVVDTLLPSSERLRELRDDFPVIAQRRGWFIHSFQEQHGVRCLGGKKVVEDTSSYLHSPSIEVTQHIANDHMDMCRFSGLLDVEYRKVAAALERLVQDHPAARKTTGAAPEPAPPAIDPQRCRETIESLAFEQMGDRQMNIKRHHRKTCAWLRSSQEYIDWQDEAKMPEHNGVLWIKGKAGTGKSTLMKYLLECAKKGLQASRVVSFFFHARGDEFEKSTTGMYRHLAIQILLKITDDELVAVWKRLVEDSGLEDSIVSPRWTVDLLKDLFRAAVLVPRRRLTCFVDALDECDEHEIRDMLDFFTELGELSLSQGAPFQVCFSSRHYPHITVDKCLELNLDVQSGHERDIISYLETELKIGKTKTAKEVRSEMLKSSSGIFMWAVLVTQILNREFDRGNIHALKKKLKEIPKDLNTLFESILARDDDNKAQLLLCIQWTLYARRPLVPEELYFAMLPCDSEPDELPIRYQPWNPDEITRDYMGRFIVSSSKGLVEVTSTKKPTVQFIHESVRDYLFQGGLEKVWSGIRGDFSSISHEALKNGCLSYIQHGEFGAESRLPSTEESAPRSATPDHIVDIEGYSNPSATPENLTNSPLVTKDDVPGSSTKAKLAKQSEAASIMSTKFPFLQYALQNVIHHADRAQQGGLCQLQFLNDFPKDQWIKLDNAMSAFKSRQHTAKAPMLYLLAEQNAASLIKVSPERRSFRDYLDPRKPSSPPTVERYGPPLVAAIANGSHEAIKELIVSDADLSGLIEESLIEDASTQLTKGRPKLSLRWNGLKSMAYYLCEYGHAPFVKLVASAAAKKRRQGADCDLIIEETLLSMRALDLITTKKEGGLLKAMISGGACQMPWYADRLRNLIGEAFLKNDLSCLKDGLDSGNEPSILAGSHIKTWVPRELWEAQFKELVRDPCRFKQNLLLLIGAGYDVNVLTPEGSNLVDDLFCAQSDAYITSFLLELGAKPTGIWAAAALGDKDAIIRLLDDGFDVNSRGYYGRSALWCAALNNHEDLVEMLLVERGANPNLTDSGKSSLLHHMANFKGTKAIPIAKILIKNGVEVNAKNSENETPLILAWQARSIEFADMLFQAGADVNVKDSFGTTPLYTQSNPEIIAFLRTHGADVNAKDEDGYTPLHAQNNPEIIALLCTHGADVNAKAGPSGRTPLHCARSEECIEVLCENHADLESRDRDGFTPLLSRIKAGQAQAVGALLKRGARKDVRTNRGETAWQLASDIAWIRGEQSWLILELLGPEP